MVDFPAMTNGLTNNSEYWASIRTRKRGDGGLSHAVLYRLDGGQRTLTFRDNTAAAEAFAAAVKAHGIRRALAMHGYVAGPLPCAEEPHGHLARLPLRKPVSLRFEIPVRGVEDPPVVAVRFVAVRPASGPVSL